MEPQRSTKKTNAKFKDKQTRHEEHWNWKPNDLSGNWNDLKTTKDMIEN